MAHILDQPLVRVAHALRRGTVSSSELVEEAVARHERRGPILHAYKHFDPEGARGAAAEADRILASGGEPPPLCGIPISVKDLFGVQGLPTFAGTPRRLPERWERDGWLVARLRGQGAVLVGKTHTVELAYGGIGVNPHWGTPRNPWDADVHRVPGGSSAGAGVSLWEGSALVALGTDTGGSIRIPATMTGVVGHKTTKGRWSTEGVVPLSSTLDTVGALTRSVADAVFFFGAVDPGLGEPAAFLRDLVAGGGAVRMVVPRCGIWADCPSDMGDVLARALDELVAAGWDAAEVDGRLLDDAVELYGNGGIAGVECRAFLERELPGWLDILHPIVGKRIESAARHSAAGYEDALLQRRRLEAAAEGLFGGADVLALPTGIITPPTVAEVGDMERYVERNAAALRPTCAVNTLGLCALTLPVGRDGAGMPVGLQLVARGGADEGLLRAALSAERVLGTAVERMGPPPAVPS